LGGSVTAKTQVMLGLHVTEVVVRILHKGGASIVKTLSISQKNISAMTTTDVQELANRLEVDNYSNAFEGLNDWHLLRAIAFQRPELVEPYIYLLDLEAYDEA
jgi:hypothetical protein